MSATAAIRTQLTSVIDTLTTPVVLGPMANVAGGSLAGRVSKAGGLGFIGAGTFDAAKLQAEIETAHQILGIDKPLRGTGNRVHLGIGFLVWRLSNLNKGPPPSLGASDLDASSPALHLIDAALRSKPRAIWLSFGDEADMVGWSSIVRDREAALNGAGKAAWGKELKLFVGVGNEAQAKAAVEDCGADVVVVQGNEAGGHGLAASPPLSVALSQIGSRMGDWKPSNPSGITPPVLAAGGLMNGAHLASALAQGAAGGVFGTRFLLTPEAAYSDAQKQVLLDAGGDSTLRSMAFDDARNTLGWPEGVDGRGIYSDTVRDFEAAADAPGGTSAEARQARYKQAEAVKDAKRIVTWAGTGIGLGTRIMPAEDIVREVSRDAADSIKRISSYV